MVLYACIAGKADGGIAKEREAEMLLMETFFHKPTSTTAELLFVVVSNTADTVTRQEVFRHDPLIPIEGYCCAPSSNTDCSAENSLRTILNFCKSRAWFSFDTIQCVSCND